MKKKKKDEKELFQQNYAHQLILPWKQTHLKLFPWKRKKDLAGAMEQLTFERDKDLGWNLQVLQNIVCWINGQQQTRDSDKQIWERWNSTKELLKVQKDLVYIIDF